MTDILMREYWSKADAFLLPLTGLRRDDKFDMKAHLFWNEYTIYDYNLVVSFSLDQPEQLMNWCRKFVFPTLDKNGYLMENYDVGDRSIFVLDISQWSGDINVFLKGKYSKLSKPAKKLIIDYHKFNGNDIPISIYATLYPDSPLNVPEGAEDKLDGLTPLEYVSRFYGFDLDELKKIGEIGTIYDNMTESLIIDSDFCQQDMLTQKI